MRVLKLICANGFLAAFNAAAADPAAALTAAEKAKATPIQDKIITYLIEDGPKLLGALAIVVAGMLAARWVGQLVMRWLAKRDLEPPVRMLLTRLTKLLVFAFSLVIALGTMGVNMMAAVTGIGVLGVGVSLATQGVLSTLVAGVCIIFTKPFPVGGYRVVVGGEGAGGMIEPFSP